MTVSGLSLVEPDEEETVRNLLQMAFRGYARDDGWCSLLEPSNRRGELEPGSAQNRVQIKVQIEMLGLHPDLHGYGLGQAMLYTTEKEIQERGYHWVELHTAEMFDRLIRFYTNQGYRITHHGSNPTADDGYQRVFLDKPLTEEARNMPDKPGAQRRT